MNIISDNTIKGFTGLIASKEPVPGGGGASALAGAIGVALGDMVGELTLGKKKYAEFEEENMLQIAKAQDLRVRLIEAIDEDAAAFAPLAEAYSIPKDAPGRDETMEKCLRQAASAPLKIFELCCESIQVVDGFRRTGSKIMLSDAATGAAILKGALFGAAVNVKVNTKLMKDRDYASAIDAKINADIEKYGRLADEIFESIYGGY